MKLKTNRDLSPGDDHLGCDRICPFEPAIRLSINLEILQLD